MEKTNKEIAVLAATWWADQVAKPKFDNGDDNPFASGFASILANQLVEQIPSATRVKFIQLLSGFIEEWLEKRNYQLVLGVDYGPDGYLSEPAEEAGIPFANFPWKTNMWIDRNHVSVSLGYRGKSTFLYANKAYWEEELEYAEKSLEKLKSGETYSWVDDPEKKDWTEREIELKENRIKELKEELANFKEDYKE